MIELLFMIHKQQNKKINKTEKKHKIFLENSILKLFRILPL